VAVSEENIIDENGLVGG